MTLPTQQPISLSQISPFLAHVGARLGVFDDPPGPSVAIEGGLFGGALYAGLVYTPTAPASGTSRVDLAIANPAADGGAAIEVIEGTDDNPSAPDISSYPGAAPIAEITVTGNSNGKVVVRRSDILDLRPILQVPASAYSMLFHGRLVLGGNMPQVGSKELLGPNASSLGGLEDIETNYPFPQVLTVKATKNTNKASANGTTSWVDLEMPYYVDDFHVVGIPFDTSLRAGSSGAVSGFWVKRLASTTFDSLGRGLPLIRIGVHATGDLFADQRFSDHTRERKRFAYFDFQAWGRLS